MNFSVSLTPTSYVEMPITNVTTTLEDKCLWEEMGVRKSRSLKNRISVLTKETTGSSAAFFPPCYEQTARSQSASNLQLRKRAYQNEPIAGWHPIPVCDHLLQQPEPRQGYEALTVCSQITSSHQNSSYLSQSNPNYF